MSHFTALPVESCNYLCPLAYVNTPQGLLLPNEKIFSIQEWKLFCSSVNLEKNPVSPQEKN